MKLKNKEYLDKLLHTEEEHLRKLNKIISDAMTEEKLITQNLFSAQSEKTSFGNRVADRVARFGGSWSFIFLFFTALLLWIIINTVALVWKPFDPYPFILLNLILSCIAAIQAPVIMMSQNRQEEKDRKRSENDYLINLKAEIEIRNLHEKIDLLMLEQFKNLLDIQKVQIELLEKIDAKIGKAPKE